MPKWLNATAIQGTKEFRNEQTQPWLHITKNPLQNSLIKSEYSTQYTTWLVFLWQLHPVFYKRNVKISLFLQNWLKINSWHYLHLPKNTAQPSAPSPEVVGQAMERKKEKYVADWNSQEFKQLLLGNQSITLSNYWITNLFHISLLQLSQ